MPEQKRLLSILLTVAVVAWLALPAAPAFAFHFPWDQGHDTFEPDDGDDDTDPEDEDCNETGSPVEVQNGNFIHEAQDLLIRARGFDIDITRVYNSRDARSGMFGHGWTFTFDQRLVETTDGVSEFAICREQSGKRERFLKGAGGVFVPPEDNFSTLTKNPDGTLTVTARNGVERQYDAAGRLIALVDRNGNAMTLDYDSDGFLIDLTDSSGRTVSFTKGADGRVSEIHDPLGRTVRYTYDAEGNLVSFEDAVGNSTTYVYDSKHNLLQVIDPRGNVVQDITYDAEQRATSFLEGGEIWTMSYSPAAGRTTKTDSSGNEWIFLYNQNGNITRQVDPLGGVLDTTYNQSFLPVQMTDANGNTTTLTYDANGNVTRLEDALGNVSNVTYEPALNQVATITDPRGSTTTFAYDSKGNLIRLTDALGNQTQMTYDSFGQMVSLADAAGATWQFAYDANGNLNRTIDPVGNTTVSTFDQVSRLLSTTDGAGQTISYTFDAKDRLVEIIDSFGSRTQVAYDASDNPVSVTDANGHATTFVYDTFSRVTQQTSALGQSRMLTYDGKGNVLSLQDAKGQTTIFDYDPLSRLTQRTTPDNTITYAYDAVGNILRIVDSDSGLTFGYDSADRIIEARTDATVAQPATTLNYSLDANGNPVSMTDPLGRATAYEYDALNLPVAIETASGSKTVYAYDPVSRRTEVGLPNGIDILSTMDSAGRLTGLRHRGTSGDLLVYSFSYDGAGRRVAIGDSSGNRQYAYDAVGRLSGVVTSSGTPLESYGYDAVGNRLTSHLATGIYDAANRLVEDDAFTYVYDANGNLTAKSDKASGDTTAYAYDAEDRLVSIAFPDGGSASYRYDGLGRRIEKNVSGVISRYVYDGGDVLLEYDGSSVLVASLVHGPGIDEPVSIELASGSFFYHTDGLGSVTALSASDESLVRTYTYDAFGQITSETGTLANMYAFTGRERDEESGLYYYRARYYDPRTGRFLSEDPVPFLEGGYVNLYPYTENDPVNFIDPTGELAWFVAPIVGALVGGGIDLGWQLIQNGGNIKCVDWGDVALSAGLGAGFSMLGPSGPIFGRAGAKAASFGYKGGFLNTGNFRTGWSWHQGRNWFGVHGGKPFTPGHWHRTPIPGPSGTGVAGFGVGGGVAGGVAGAAIGGGADCDECE